MPLFLPAIVSAFVTASPAFTTSEDAVRYLQSHLRAGNFDTLRAAFQAPQDQATFVFLAKRLQTLDRKTPLATLYAGRAFPVEGTRFKLGGHGQPWDHLHVNFVKIDDRWVLQSLTQCR
jgi:hypothetical protein